MPCKGSIGGAEGDRTPDLVTASHALSQLSYSPTKRAHPSTRYLLGWTDFRRGSGWGPVALPVFKTACRAACPSGVGSTPTRFRHGRPRDLAVFRVVRLRGAPA